MLSGKNANQDFVDMLNRNDLTDDVLLSAMEEFLSVYDEETFRGCYRTSNMTLTFTESDGTDTEFKGPILFKMVLQNYLKCMQKLIDLGIDVNETVYSYRPKLGGFTALILAANKNSVDMVRLLLSNKGDIFQTLRDGTNVLYQVTSAEVCDMILEKAKETDAIHRLMDAYDSCYLNPVYFATRGRPRVLASIIKAVDIRLYANLADLLEKAVLEDWNEILTLLEPLAETHPVYTIDDENQAYQELVKEFDTSSYNDMSNNVRRIRAYVLKYGRAAFAERASRPDIKCGTNSALNNVQTLFGTPLFIASYSGDTDFMRYLIFLGVDINSGAKCLNPDGNNLSPLSIACDKGKDEAVKLLLNEGADLLKVSDTKKSCLVNASDKSIFDLVLKKADEIGCLDKFLYQKGMISTAFEEADLFTVCAVMKRFDLLNYLLDNPKWIQFADLVTLRSACYASALDSSAYGDQAMKIVGRIQKQIHSLELVAPLRFKRNEHQKDDNNTLNTANDGFKKLFGKDISKEIPTTKESALQLANAQLISLLHNPERCLPFLRFLNDEFIRYIREHHPDFKFPVVDRNEFASVFIDRTEYPVPMPDSRYVNGDSTNLGKQYSILKEFLITIFRKHDMAQIIVKWVGFVDHVEANQMVTAGHFIIESSSAGVSLIHGGLSHAVQTIMMIYAIERGDINMEYTEAGERKRLSMKELFASHVELKRPNNDIIWYEMRDTRVKSTVRFCDPYRLFALIMLEGKQLGVTALSDYLTHGFGKSLVKYHRTMAKFVPVFQRYSTFIDAIAHLPSHIIFNRQHIIQQTTDKYIAATYQYGAEPDMKRYKVVSKDGYAFAEASHYRPKSGFTPRMFTQAASEVYEVTTKLTVNEDDTVYVSGTDPLLGRNFFASPMYFDAQRDCWAYNLPPGLKQHEHHFLTGSRRPHFAMFTRQQDGEPMIEASCLDKVTL